MKNKSKEIKLIESQIIEKFGTKSNFCEKTGIDFKNFSSKKLSALQNKLDWITDFLELLDMKIKIKNK